MTYQGEKRENIPENVKVFWDETAKRFGAKREATIRDVHLQDLEIAAIKGIIQGRDDVLDVGCGNGYATMAYARSLPNSRVVGIDYCENFIRAANNHLLVENRQVVYGGLNNILFKLDDVTSLGFKDESFDCVIGQRVLINLSTRERQQRAVDEIWRVLKHDGSYACEEVTEQGHQEVNRLRREFGLGDLERYWHNLYIDEPEFLKLLDSKGFDLVERRRFSTYQFISKVFYPASIAPEEPVFESSFNRNAMRIAETTPEFPGFENCSHQVMFVARKK